MQEIFVSVRRGGREIDTFCFPDPPMPGAAIREALEDAGYKGVLESGRYTYTSKHLLQQGAYTFKVSEAAPGKSISRPSCLVWVASA